MGRRVIRAEVQSEEHRLDPDVVQAVSVPHLALHGLHGGIQQDKAVLHLLDVCLILRRGVLRDGPTVKAQIHHSAVVLRPAGEGGAEEGQKENDGREYVCQHPPHSFPSLFIGENGRGSLEHQGWSVHYPPPPVTSACLWGGAWTSSRLRSAPDLNRQTPRWGELIRSYSAASSWRLSM